MKKLLYIGYLGQNNTGDELMWDVFKDLCTKHGVYDRYEVISTAEDAGNQIISSYDVVVLGGGSLLYPEFIDTLYKAMISGSKVFVWGSGFDRAEKDFIEMLEFSDTPAYLFPDETEMILQELVPKCEFIGVRGPLTYNIFKKSFIDVSNLIISGDPGLLLNTKPLEDYMPITTLSDDDKIVALNWGTSYNNIYGNDEKYVEDELIKVCEYLLSNGYKVYLYMMWDEDLESVIRLYHRIKSNENLILDTNIYSGGQLLSILKKCAFSINFKLHGNVTSVAGNIPFICLGYRFKCFDFVKSIGCNNLIVSTDSNDIYSDVMNCINYINENYDEIKTNMQTYVDDYKIKVESPFTKGLF